MGYIECSSGGGGKKTIKIPSFSTTGNSPHAQNLGSWAKVQGSLSLNVENYNKLVFDKITLNTANSSYKDFKIYDENENIIYQTTSNVNTKTTIDISNASQIRIYMMVYAYYSSDSYGKIENIEIS